jgi:hypothetical protein
MLEVIGMIREIGMMVVGAWAVACAGSGAAQKSDAAPVADSVPPESTPAPTPEPSTSVLASNAGSAPAAEPAAPGSCTVGKLETIPTELSRTDHCRGTFYCPGARTILVGCDGENDGTNTSLCECEERGKRASPSKPVPGEAPDSCIAAADLCLAALGR